MTGKAIVNSAIKFHRTLGPGLLESVYQKCLKYILVSAELKCTIDERQNKAHGEQFIGPNG